MILPCLGVTLAWYGFIPTELPHTATTGTYSIDGQSAMSFPLKGLPATSSITIHNQKFFETATLPYGHHNITVSFQGNEETTPLTLDYLVVQNGTVPEGSSTSSSLSGSSPKDAGSSTSPPGSPPGSSPTGKNAGSNVNGTSSKINVGVIAGGIVGAVGLILLVCLLLLCYRRKQRKQQNLRDKEIPATGVEPFLGKDADQHSTTALPNHSMWGRIHLLTSYGTDLNANSRAAYQIMPTKLRQEMQASAAVAQPLRPQQPGQMSSSRSGSSPEATGAAGTSGSGQRLAGYEDRRIRLPRRGGSTGVIEVPPTYTLG